MSSQPPRAIASAAPSLEAVQASESPVEQAASQCEADFAPSHASYAPEAAHAFTHPSDAPIFFQLPALETSTPTASPTASASVPDASSGPAWADLDPTLPLEQALLQLLPAARVSTRLHDRRIYARDLWPQALLEALHGKHAPLPRAIVWPESEAEVQALVRFAAQHRWPLTPYGAGSGVLGGAMPDEGGLLVDLKRMDQVRSLDPLSGVLEVEPGMIGWHLKSWLKLRGFTLGHFPSSLMTATLGGYAATRSAGQFSSRYGKIEDMILSVRCVDGHGNVLDTSREGLDREPDLTPLLVGSEGTLGIITLIRLRVQRQPVAALYRGHRFHSVEAGLTAMRRIMQAGLRPSVLRLYDALDTFMVGRGDKPLDAEEHSQLSAPSEEKSSGLGHALKHQVRSLLDRYPEVTRGAVRMALGRPVLLETLREKVLPHEVLLVIGTEGEPEEVHACLESMRALCQAEGGEDLGEGPGLRWLKKRYDVSFKMPTFYYHGAFVDTIEVAAPWSQLPALYHAVRAAVSEQVMVMAHFSHAYSEGAFIYFSLGGSAESLASALSRYHTAWEKALEVVLALGGTISHHHGVGKHKALYATREVGQLVAVWQVLKQQLDPHGILNPGKLFVSTPTEAVQPKP